MGYNGIIPNREEEIWVEKAQSAKVKAQKSKRKSQKLKRSSRKSSKISPPQTMEELLAMEEARVRPLKRGDKVKAKILKIGQREIVCDISGKSYALVVGRQFELIREYLPFFQVGDEVLARVVIAEMEGGETLLSFREAALERVWESLRQAKDKGEELEVTALKVISGGLLVECRTLRGFIPQAQIDSEFAQNPQKLMGRRLKVKVLEVGRRQNRLVLSQKEVTQKEELRRRRRALSLCKVGEELKGKILAVEKYGLLVGVMKKKIELEGWVHISEISWRRIEDLSELYKVGEKVKVKVLGINEAEARLELSLKQLQPDPWEKIEEKYPLEETVKGKVVKVSSLGAFVELSAGIEGLLHISKIPAGREFKKGEKISVVIEKIDKENRRLSLSYVPVKKPIGYR